MYIGSEWEAMWSYVKLPVIVSMGINGRFFRDKFDVFYLSVQAPVLDIMNNILS